MLKQTVTLINDEAPDTSATQGVRSDNNAKDAAFALVRGMTDIVLEITDAAPVLAQAASSIERALPIRNRWVRQALAVCGLSATAFAILAYSSLKSEGRQRHRIEEEKGGNDEQ